MIVGGVTLAVLAMAWYAKTKVTEAGKAVADTVVQAWDNAAGALENAGASANGAVFGSGNNIFSVTPLYQWKNTESAIYGEKFNDRRYEAAREKRAPDYAIGDINDGAIF